MKFSGINRAGNVVSYDFSLVKTTADGMQVLLRNDSRWYRQAGSCTISRVGSPGRVTVLLRHAEAVA